MTTDEENSVKVLGVADELGQLLRVLEERFFMVQEIHRLLITLVDGTRIKWRFTTGRRCNGDLRMRLEHFVWVCKFWLDGPSAFFRG